MMAQTEGSKQYQKYSMVTMDTPPDTSQTPSQLLHKSASPSWGPLVESWSVPLPGGYLSHTSDHETWNLGVWVSCWNLS